MKEKSRKEQSDDGDDDDENKVDGGERTNPKKTRPFSPLALASLCCPHASTRSAATLVHAQTEATQR